MRYDINDKLIVSEIFDSIEGEGKRQGQFATFIRLAGCNLRCSYCDTAYAFDGGEELSVPNIIRRIRFPNVTVTGGEPLKQNIHWFLDRLPGHISVNIETNGSIDIEDYLRWHGRQPVFFTMDYKCKSSGVDHGINPYNVEQLREQDVLKFVVGSEEDLDEARDFCRLYHPKAMVYVSPVFGKMEPSEIVEYMKREYLTDWRVQLQIHKFIWNPQERGV